MSIKLYKNPTVTALRALTLIGLTGVAVAAWVCPVQAEERTENTAWAATDCGFPVPLQAHITEALIQLVPDGDHRAYWSRDERLSDLVAALDDLIYDGLPPMRYQVERLHLSLMERGEGEPLTACDAELASRSFLRALSDLKYGKLNPQELGLIWYAPDQIEPRTAQALIELAGSEPLDIVAAFETARPDLLRYRQLRQAYQRALHMLPEDWPIIPAGVSLKEGDLGPRVALLRKRLAAQGYVGDVPEGTDPFLFASDLTLAVRAFQQDHNLEADGVVGRKTLAELHVPPATRLAEVRANLERFRWLAHDWEPSMVLVDIAGANIERYKGGERVWSGKTQVGRPARPTPRLKSVITHVTVNPTWTIPPTVLYQDIVPAASADPGYLRSNRIRVFDTQGTEVNPDEVNWSNPTGLLLRQDAGPNNALGRVAIRFPNPFTVYLHDTPSQHLFGTPYRFYSSGCVRIESATGLTRRLFEDAGPTALSQYETGLSSGQSRNIKLELNLPVVLAYWTAQANGDGLIDYRNDRYEANAQLIDLLDSHS